MARRAFAATGEEGAVTSAYTTALSLAGAATVRPKIYDAMFSAGAAPADTVLVFALQRFSATPTVTGVTPVALDPAEPAATAIAGENASAEGTYTAATELLEFDMNQRATYRWVAAPEGELIIPATASNGIGGRVKAAAYTGPAKVLFHFAE